jgi:iron complex transport system substrate-binding protein
MPLASGLILGNYGGMKKICPFLAGALACLLLCAGCAKVRQGAEPPPESAGAPAITEAKLFSIDYMPDGVKLLTDYDGRRCLLVPRGAAAPPVKADVVVRVPVERALYMSVTQVSFLDALGDTSLFDSVAAVTVPADDWVIEPVAERMRNGKTRYIAQSLWGAMDTEAMIKLAPDIIFADSVNPGSGDISGQFEAAGLPYVVVGEWLEDTSRASFEWIKFIAAFYNRDEEADRIFRQTLARLDGLIKLAAGIPAGSRPIAAYGSVYNGVVYTQGGDSTAAREWRNAGAGYFLDADTGGGSLRLTVEEFFDKARNADVLIYSSMIRYTPDKRALLEESPLFAEFKAFKNDRIYVFSDGYYMNSARPDVKFEETAAIFHPELFSGGSLFYVKLPD